MANGIPFESALEYLRASLNEKLKDLERDFISFKERDFISFKADIGAQIQTLRRDSRQLVEKQFESERAATAQRSEFERAIDARIENIEILLKRLDATGKWFAGTALSIIGVAATALVLRWLGV